MLPFPKSSLRVCRFPYKIRKRFLCGSSTPTFQCYVTSIMCTNIVNTFSYLQLIVSSPSIDCYSLFKVLLAFSHCLLRKILAIAC